MTGSDYRRAVEVANVTGSRQPPGRALDHGECVAALVIAADECEVKWRPCASAIRDTPSSKPSRSI